MTNFMGELWVCPTGPHSVAQSVEEKITDKLYECFKPIDTS